MFRFFETRIDPFREHDESTPPASLFGYYGRYCRQVWPFLVALMAIGLVVSLIEVSILRFVGDMHSFRTSVFAESRSAPRRAGLALFGSGVRRLREPSDDCDLFAVNGHGGVAVEPGLREASGEPFRGVTGVGLLRLLPAPGAAMPVSVMRFHDYIITPLHV